MEIVRRKGVSPVLATVILIAITLVAAVAIATFVFGLFGTSISGPQLSIIGWTGCTAGRCTFTVANSGPSQGIITSAGPAANFSINGTQTIKANSHALVYVSYTGTGQVTGFLVQGNGPNLVFSVVLP